jgi:uncharacterized RDD family membrane protein YckC
MKYASLSKRLVAVIIDIGICVALAAIAYNELKPLLDLNNQNNLSDQVQGITWMISWIYFASMESSRLQATFGKMLFRIKVTDMEENRISFWKASVGYWGKLLFPFGCITIFFTKNKQWLHDQEWLHVNYGRVVLDKRNNAPQ